MQLATIFISSWNSPCSDSSPHYKSKINEDTQQKFKCTIVFYQYDAAVFIFSLNQKFLPCSTASSKPVHQNCTRVDSTYIKSAIAKLTNRIQRELKILPDVIKAHNLPTWGQSEPTATNTTPIGSPLWLSSRWTPTELMCLGVWSLHTLHNAILPCSCWKVPSQRRKTQTEGNSRIWPSALQSDHYCGKPSNT